MGTEIRTISGCEVCGKKPFRYLITKIAYLCVECSRITPPKEGLYHFKRSFFGCTAMVLPEELMQRFHEDYRLSKYRITEYNRLHEEMIDELITLSKNREWLLKLLSSDISEMSIKEFVDHLRSLE